MLDMLRDFPDFERHLLNDIVNIYDDDLKLFLTATLRKIDYLADVDEEIIVQLAYMCCPEIKEKGSMLYSMEEDPDEQINDEIIIVFDGSIELFLTMDTGTDFSLENLPTGSILNAHNCLAKRKHSINSRFTINTTFYYLKYHKIVEVAQKFPKFLHELQRQKGRAEVLAHREQDPLDFIRGIQVFEDARDKKYDEETSKKMLRIMLALKNSVVYYLLRNRKDRKVKNLR